MGTNFSTFHLLVSIILLCIIIGCESGQIGSINVTEDITTTSSTSTTVSETTVKGGTVFKIILNNDIIRYKEDADTAGTKQIYLKYNYGYYLERACETKLDMKSSGIECPTKNGYTFLGYVCEPSWYEDWNGNMSVIGGRKIITEKGLLDIDISYTDFTEDTELYAMWKRNTTHTIHYLNTKDATNDNPTTFTEEASAIVLQDLGDVIGYTFDGWVWHEDDEGGGVYDIWKGEQNDITLYARWIPIKYKVKFYDTFDGNIYEMTEIEQEFIYDVSEDLPEFNSHCNTDGWHFIGWNTKLDGTGISFADRQNVKNLSSGETVDLYAQWLGNDIHRIIYVGAEDSNILECCPQTFREGQSVDFSNYYEWNIERIGYTFDGFYDASVDGNRINAISAESNEDEIVYVRWIPWSYYVYFEGNGGLGWQVQEFTYDVSQDLRECTFDRIGYRFIGWNTKSDGSGISFDDRQNVKNLLSGTLYAQWAENDAHTITYIGADNIPLGQNPQSFKENNNVALSDISQTGYYFGGWYDNEDFIGEKVTGWSAGAKTEDVTLYAKWTPMTYNIYYWDEGAKTFSGVHGANYPTQHTYGTATVLDTPTKEGYVFGGWHLMSDCSDNSIDVIGATDYDDSVCLYAKWTPAIVNYTVKRYFQNVSGTGYEQNLTDYPNLIMSGIALLTTNVSADEVSGFNSSWITQQTIKTDGSTVVEIRYNRKTITYTFDTNDGKWSDNTTANKTVSGLFGAEVSGLPENPRRVGYLFDGWDSEVPSIYDTTIDMTFTAKWILDHSPECSVQSLSSLLSSVDANDGIYQIKIIDTEPSLYSIKNILTLYNDVQVVLDLSQCGSLRTIGNNAFEDCENLTGCIMPNSVTSINKNAFAGCSGLSSITIPNSVTSIGEYAFYNCSGLTGIEIPNSVASIGEYAFYNCSGLTSVTIPFVGLYADATGENAKFYRIFGTSSSDAPASLKEVVITGGASIGEFAFNGCSGLTSVTIPDSVTSIGSGAFYDCSGLTSIVIPDSVESIVNTFNGCSGLTSVTIPDSVTNIGSCVFYDCSGLTSIVLPDSVTNIGDSAFSGCSGLTSIEISNSVTSIGEYAFYNCSGLTSVTIPDSVTSIGYSVFRDCSGLTSVAIPDSVTRIGNFAFSGCSGLASVTIPDSVTSIGGSAFSGCSGLASVTIPDSVTSIGGSAFSGCSGLTRVTIPDSVTSIGNGAFYNCSGLTEPVYNVHVFVKMHALYTGEYTIPDSVTSIDYSAFSGCSGLTRVTIPDSVINIGNRAFSDCNGLIILYVKATTPPNFGSSMLEKCSSLSTIYVPSASITAYKNATGWKDFADKIVGQDF